jgi:hypothetical protein
VSSNDAEKIVSQYPIGTFVLRLSNTTLGAFALTVKQQEKVKHFAITRSPENVFILGKESDKSVEELLNKHGKRLHLLYPAQGSPFLSTMSALAMLDQNNPTKRYSTFDD